MHRPDSDYSAKVDVYEDRVTNWFINVARNHVDPNSGPGDYVAVMVALSYIEGVEQYRRGSKAPAGKSGEWFCASVQRIIPNLPNGADKHLWKEVRNGMFHSGFTEGKTLITHVENVPVSIREEYLRINPLELMKQVDQDFRNYISDLRNDSTGNLAQNFTKLWDERWENT